MRKVDAPPAGWYPDPGSRTQLRWWDGLDWANIRRAPPSGSELLAAKTLVETQQRVDVGIPPVPQTGLSRADTQQIIADVRDVARDEVDRAAELFGQRATAAAREFTPLVTQYTNQAIKWIRIAVVVAAVLLIGWFVFQVLAQATLLEWLGDRIDNITDQNSARAPFPIRSVEELSR
jgi:hypothetical protein